VEHIRDHFDYAEEFALDCLRPGDDSSGKIEVED
jgi:hypothetical protein